MQHLWVMLHHWFRSQQLSQQQQHQQCQVLTQRGLHANHKALGGLEKSQVNSSSMDHQAGSYQGHPCQHQVACHPVTLAP
jgi:hypothetical protein